jgi:hypothetical protein
MMVGGKVADNERADLFRVSPFMDTTAREVGARIRNGGY